jgi:hypothetical protein
LFADVPLYRGCYFWGAGWLGVVPVVVPELVEASVAGLGVGVGVGLEVLMVTVLSKGEFETTVLTHGCTRIKIPGSHIPGRRILPGVLRWYNAAALGHR